MQVAAKNQIRYVHFGSIVVIERVAVYAHIGNKIGYTHFRKRSFAHHALEFLGYGKPSRFLLHAGSPSLPHE